MEQQDLYTEYRKHLKERILTVAMQAFKQHGIRNVRMDDIATTLAISKYYCPLKFSALYTN